MATTDQLTTSTTSVVVHPLVLLSIQDHAARSAKGTKKRVLGILLGQDNGSRGINVANSFAGELPIPLLLSLRALADKRGTVPFEEDEKDPRTWYLDHNYIESMNDMFKKVNGSSPHSLPAFSS
jgi:26S proteasome regulatory subunit N8